MIIDSNGIPFKTQGLFKIKKDSFDSLLISFTKLHEVTGSQKRWYQQIL